MSTPAVPLRSTNCLIEPTTQQPRTTFVRGCWHTDSMSHDMRARPTLQVLRSLQDGWESASQQRAIQDQRWHDLHPLAELAHPILAKCREQFGSDPAADLYRGRIDSSGALALAEVRNQQWRAGVWTDPESRVRWILAVGLAKGGHEDHDDFYERLAAQVSRTGGDDLLPTPEDVRLLRRETMAWVLTQAELDVQAASHDLLDGAMQHGSARAILTHPTRMTPQNTPLPLITAVLAWAALHEPEFDYEDLVVEFIDSDHSSPSLLWTLQQRLLISLAPPTQGWDIAGGIYSAMEEHGHARARLQELQAATQCGELLAPDMGAVSHYTHKRHITDAVVNAQAVRALCGVFFVPTHDPANRPVCPTCDDTWAKLAT